MKKSELRNIIKETIKETIKGSIKEQNPIISAVEPCDADCRIAFPNCKNWLGTVSSSSPFTTSTNPLQPCTFINNKINQYQTQLSTMGNSSGPWGTQISCKLSGFQYLHQINNC